MSDFDKEKAHCILELQKQKADHFKQTRDIEFKVNISIWTLIVLMGYYGKIQFIHYVVIASAIFIVHLIWLFLIQNSEDNDHNYMNQCRDVVEKMVELPIKKRELTGIDICLEMIAQKLGFSAKRWIVLEITMTVVLLVGAGFIIFSNNVVIVPQYLIKNVVLSSKHLGIKFGDLLTIYGLYLVFVIFCFQEINDKIRHGQDKFRSWCSSRKGELAQLGINWEIDSWLEKDLIFHLYDFKIKIQIAKEKIQNGEAGIEEAKRVIHEKACEDYFDYIYQCLKFKNEHKKHAMWLFLLLIVFNIARFFQENISLDMLSYAVIILLIVVVYWMLRGPNFKVNFNNPFTGYAIPLKPDEMKKLKELEELVKEI